MLRSIDEIRNIYNLNCRSKAFTYRSIFEYYKIFNAVQSEVFDDVFNTNKSIIISAPTGSGKTVIFELAIIRLLQINHQQEDFKIVYVAPIKALCSERFTDWSRKFHSYGLQCLEVTGDSDIQDFSDLISAKIIITTPEKWDSLTRKWKEYQNIVTTVKLFMIDEIHLLNEDGRGPILEAIVSRMKTIQFSIKIIGNRKNDMCLRFIGASATIPNIKDIAEWIGGRDMNNISFFQISEEHRPVKLEKHILGYTNGSSSFKFDIHLNYKLADIIRKYANGKPTLIFCSSRKSVEMASDVLQKYPCLIPLSESHKSTLNQLSRSLRDKKLHGLIIKGIAYHHAGLTYEDRNIIENSFRQGLLMILVSTNTLAMGVNLPAHLVIIKSTETFIRGTVIEYSESSILQMIGRAGRPQFDVTGVAVIMTQQKYVKKYENLMNGCTPVESHLHKHLTEHLNSEIVLQTITDIDVAMEWIRSTFLYVRAVKSPMNYGLTYGMTKEKVEKKLEEMCLIQINDLETNELITKDQTYGVSIHATQYGRLMARYYLSFETMKLFRKIRGNESYLEMFNKIIESKEFSEFTLRVNDKKILNDLNEKPIRFPIKGKIKTNANKISCLIQANFGVIQIPDPAMMQDSLKMIRLGDRISKCCLEYLRLSEKRLDKNYGIYKALLNIIMIAKSYRAKLWENSEYVCKQLNKIGNVYSSLLVNAGKTTLKSILETEPRTLEMILGKQPPFGNDIHKSLLAFPQYELQLTMRGSHSAQVFIKQLNQNYKYDNNHCTIIVGDSDNQLLLMNDKVDFTIQEYGNFDRTFKIKNNKTHAIYAHLIHESLVGVDKSSQIILNPLDDSNEKIVKKPECKKRIQTKLTNCPVPKKKSKNLTTIKNSFNEFVVDKLNESEGYESLLDDDDIFNNINTQKALLANKLLESPTQLPPNTENYQLNINSSHYSEINTKQIENTENLPIKRKLSDFEFTERSKIPKIMKPTNQTIEIFDDDDDDFEYLLQEAERKRENFIDYQLRYGNDISLLDENDINEMNKENIMPGCFVQSTGKKWEITEIRSNENSKILKQPILGNQIINLQHNKNIPIYPPLREANNQKIDVVNNNFYQLESFPNRLAETENPLVPPSNSSENYSILDLSTKAETKNTINCKINNYSSEIEQNEPLDFSFIKNTVLPYQDYNSFNQISSVEPLRPIVEKKIEYPAEKCNLMSTVNNGNNAIKNSGGNIKSFMDLEPCFADQYKENLFKRNHKRKFEVQDQSFYSTATSKLRKQDSSSQLDRNKFNEPNILSCQNKWPPMEETQFLNHQYSSPPILVCETKISSPKRIQPSNNQFCKQISQKPIKNYTTSNPKIDANNFQNNEYNQKILKLNKLPKSDQNFGILNMNISSTFAANKISELWKQNLYQPKELIRQNGVLDNKRSNFGKWEQIFSNTSKYDNCSQYLLDDEDFFNDLNYQDPYKNQNTECDVLVSDIEPFSTNKHLANPTSILMAKSKTLGMTKFNNKSIENIARPDNIFRPEPNMRQDKKFFEKTEFVKASHILEKNNLDEGLVIPQNPIWRKNIKNFATSNEPDVNKSYEVTKINEDNIPMENLQENFEDFITGINKTPELNEELIANQINVVDNKEIEIATNSKNNVSKEINNFIPKKENVPTFVQPIKPNERIKEILQIICIGNISAYFDNADIILQIPIYQSQQNTNQIQNPEIELFFEENLSKLNKFRNSSKLVRLQDMDEINDEQSENNIPILNFSLPKPNLFEESAQVSNKLFTAGNSLNPYRLRIPRLEKIIPVENRAYLDEQEQKRKFALSNLQRKLYTDPNYDENSYMNDYISCLMSKEVNKLFDDFGILSDDDENDYNEDNFFDSQNYLNLNESQDILFGSPNESEVENCNENISVNTKENNFILEFSQNLKESSSFDQSFFSNY